MAGDWLKICKETPEKPEILEIATILNCHPDSAFVACFKLWSWFDSHTTNGVTKSVTKVTLDALLHRDKLCDAMIQVGWLIEDENSCLSMPNFDYHNSESAKSRALAAKRQNKLRKERDKSNADSVTSPLLFALPREEKRRVNNTTSNPDGFLEFWSAYPKKIGKGAAEKSWKKMKPPLDVVLRAIEIAADSDQWRKDGGQYIPNPATWLNQKRWEDETEEQPQKLAGGGTYYPGIGIVL